MTEARPPKPKLDLVVLDCPEALDLARFYARVIGWEVDEASDRDWATLIPPEGSENPEGRRTLSFQRIDNWVEPTWPGGAHPQQFHLDLSVPDIAAAERDVLAAGARVHTHQPSEEGAWRVYLDPAGHPFCLVRCEYLA